MFTVLHSRGVGLGRGLHPVLRLRDNDGSPVTCVLAVILVRFVRSSKVKIPRVLNSFTVRFVINTTANCFLKGLTVLVLGQLGVSGRTLCPVLLLSFMFFAFSVASLLGNGNCLTICVTKVVMNGGGVVRQGRVCAFVSKLA